VKTAYNVTDRETHRQTDTIFLPRLAELTRDKNTKNTKFNKIS